MKKDITKQNGRMEGWKVGKKSILPFFQPSILPVFLFFLISFCSLSLFAQTESNKAIAQNKKYVKMDIGHGGLHCPFLGPKLETAIKNIQGAEEVKMDKVNSWMTFTLPADNAMTLEELKQIGTKAGYPADDVSVRMDSKPIPNNGEK